MLALFSLSVFEVRLGDAPSLRFYDVLEAKQEVKIRA